VTLKAYDLQGRFIRTLLNEDRVGGCYQAEWDARGVPPGIYFLRLTAPQGSLTRKVVLAR